MNISIKDILRLLRPLRIRMHINTGLFLFFAFLVAAGTVSTLLAYASLWIPIPYLIRYIFYMYFAFAVAGIIVSLFAVPGTKNIIRTADALGLKERVTTAWQLKDDKSIIAQLQREDTFKAVSETDFKSLYPVRFPVKPAAVFAALLILTSVSFMIPGNARKTAGQIEQLQDAVKEQIEKIEKVEKELAENEALEEEELKKILEETKRLAEELKDAKTEEEALKAISRTENELKKLNLRRQLNEISDAFQMNELTRSLGDALKNDSITDMKQALEEIMHQLEQGEIPPEELAEMLKQVSEQISGTETAEQLQQISEELVSDNKEMQSTALNNLANMLEQMMQSQGSAGLGHALEQLAQLMQQAKSSISQVDRSLPSGNQSGGTTQNTGNGSNLQVSNGNGQSGSNSGQTGNASGTGQLSENGQGSGSGGSQGSGQSPNAGQAGSGSIPGSGQGGSDQSNVSGGGAGQGSTNKDSGYTGRESSGGGRDPGKGYEEKYEKIYDPYRLGGDADPSYVSGQKQDSGNSSYTQADQIPVQKGEMLPYREVLTRYKDQAVSYMEEANIPLAMKEIVREYFESLE